MEWAVESSESLSDTTDVDITLRRVLLLFLGARAGESLSDVWDEVVCDALCDSVISVPSCSVSEGATPSCVAVACTSSSGPG